MFQGQDMEFDCPQEVSCYSHFSLPGSPPQLVPAGQVHPTAECRGLVFSRGEVLSGADNTARQRTRETQVRSAWLREAGGRQALNRSASPCYTQLTLLREDLPLG